MTLAYDSCDLVVGDVALQAKRFRAGTHTIDEFFEAVTGEIRRDGIVLLDRPITDYGADHQFGSTQENDVRTIAESIGECAAIPRRCVVATGDAATVAITRVGVAA